MTTDDDSINLVLTTDAANELLDSEEETHNSISELLSEAVSRAASSQQPQTITITVLP